MTTKATPYGDLGFDIKLTHMRDTDQVMWLNSNSYVSDGKDTYSINGIGEIRWKVERWNNEYEATRRYFGLSL
jgi:hypothetical protein